MFYQLIVMMLILSFLSFTIVSYLQV